MGDFLASLSGDLLARFGTPRGAAMLVCSLTGVAMVIWASFVRTMVPLRALTVGSNVMLLAGAALAPDLPNLLLNAVLVPVNAWRLMEIRRLSRRVAAATDDENAKGLWLKPYMKSRNLPAGAMLFRQGDAADAIHMVVHGEMVLDEIGKPIPLGELFGEISFFSREGRRTLSARCVTPCTVLTIGEDMFKQLYFQNPSLAFQVSKLIADRLGADIERLRAENGRLRVELAAAKAAAEPGQVA